MYSLSEEEGEEVVAAYLNGSSLRDIAARFNCSTGPVVNELEAHGIQRRRTGGPPASVRDEVFEHLDRDDCYWIGILFADGWIQQNRVALALRYTDGKHVEAFARHLGLSRAPRRFRDQIRISVHSDTIVSRLRAVGLSSPRNPSARLRLSSDFWRGMVDGDGSVLRYGDQVIVRLNGTALIVGAFLEFLRSTGCMTQAHVLPHSSIYRISISGAAARHALCSLYKDAPIALSRKSRTALEAIK